MATISTTSSKTYFSTLDGIRGIAALLIVIRHTVPFHGILFQESYLAVDLFFLLSGVVIANAYETRLHSGLSSKNFVWLRAVRLYPLYILGSALGLVSIFFDNPFEGNPLAATVLAIALLPYFVGHSIFPLNSVSWSLFFEWVVNLLYAAAFRFLTTKRILVIVAICALGLWRVLSYWGNLDQGSDNGSVIAGIPRVGFSFFSGILLWRYFTAKKSKAAHAFKSNVLSLLLVVIAASLLIVSPPHSLQPHYDFIAVTFLFPAIVFLTLALEPSPAIVNLFKFLGAVSYALYTIHLPVTSLVKTAISRYSGHTPTAESPLPLWFGLGFLAALVVVCWLADRYYDTPLRNFMLRTWRRPRPSPARIV